MPAAPTPVLDLADPVALTAALVDVPSVSGAEQVLADAVEAALTPLPPLQVRRCGNTVLARTDLGRGRRVLLLEKGKKPGVKILMSGGTRCNITHDCDARGIVEAHAGEIGVSNAGEGCRFVVRLPLGA